MKSAHLDNNSIEKVSYMCLLKGHLAVLWSWTHNKFGDRSSAVAGPHLWNSLPKSLQTSYGQFMQYLKAHLFGFWEITVQCDALTYLLTHSIWSFFRVDDVC